MNHRHRDDYVLDVGRQAHRRESRVDAVYREATESFLAKVGIDAGTWVCDVGCGTGSLLPVLARRVGAAGRVVGVDRSPDQVAAAGRLVRAAGCGNVDVRCGDATGLAPALGPFDVLVSRFVIDHVTEPEAMVGQMAARARPGGEIMVIDIDFSAARTVPRIESFETMRNLWVAAGEADGKDFARGSRLTEIFRSAGLDDVRCAAAQPVAPGGPDRHVVPAAVRVGRGRLERLGLVTAADLDALLADASAAVERENALVVQPTVFACWARVGASRRGRRCPATCGHTRAVDGTTG